MLLDLPRYEMLMLQYSKEASDAALAFFAAYRERSQPAGTHAMFHVVDNHNHLS